MDRRQGVIGSSKIDVDWGIVEELAIISSFIGNGWRKLKYQMRKKREDEKMKFTCQLGREHDYYELIQTYLLIFDFRYY